MQERPLRLAAVLTIARQVAEALDAAHQKGIVHRDLKPANIVLQGKPTSSDVVAKVLDFGLAKTFAGLSDQPLPGLKETGVDITATGGILGTPAYMSPEQARGDDVDKRTDIWSFGCVLYEMICGRRAFAGTSTTETLEGVLERDPDWTALPRSTPDIIRRLLRHCLQKEVGNRARDMGDVRLELTDALTERTPTPKGGSRGWRPVAERVLAVSAIPIIATFIWLQPQDTPSPLPLRLSRLTFEDGFQTDPALSRDGKFLAYATDRNGNFDIYTQPIEGGKAVRVTDSPAHDWEPNWSAGGQIVFRSERDGGGLYVVSPTGGSERRLTTFGRRPLWSPDGTRGLFDGGTSRKLYTVGLDGSAPKPFEAWYGGAYGWSPDPHKATMLLAGPDPQYEPLLHTIDPDDGSYQLWSVNADVRSAFRKLRIGIGRSTLAWSPDGTALYFTGGGGDAMALWKLEVNRTGGDPCRPASGHGDF